MIPNTEPQPTPIPRPSQFATALNNAMVEAVLARAKEGKDITITAEVLHDILKPLLEAVIRGTVTHPVIIQETIVMIVTGKQMGEPLETIIAKSLAAAMLAGFGLHPFYGDAKALAESYAQDPALATATPSTN